MSKTTQSPLDRIFVDDESRMNWYDSCPNIILAGLPRSGKTSILRVVFHKTAPYETSDIPPTPSHSLEIQKVASNPLVPFCIGEISLTPVFSADVEAALFQRTHTLVIVISAQNEPYQGATHAAAEMIGRCWSINPNVEVDVMVHKIDGDMFFSSDAAKVDCQREIHTNLTEWLYEQGIKNPSVHFHCTSIYDHTIFEALSQVVQKLKPEIATLEQLLEHVVTMCRMEKAFVFDVVSKLFIATDSSLLDPHYYQLCSEMIDVLIDVSCIYGKPISERRYDPKSNCTIHLDNRVILYLRELDRFLALVCVIKDDFFDRQHLMDHNINIFREAMIKVFNLPSSSSSSAAAAASGAASSGATYITLKDKE